MDLSSGERKIQLAILANVWDRGRDEFGSPSGGGVDVEGVENPV